MSIAQLIKLSFYHPKAPRKMYFSAVYYRFDPLKMAWTLSPTIHCTEPEMKKNVVSCRYK